MSDSHHLSWVAVAYGALDSSTLRLNTRSHVELILMPTTPSEPIGMAGPPAALWRRLVYEGPLLDAGLSSDDKQLVREFSEFGLASSDEKNNARISQLEGPWFSSPFHELVVALVASIARDNDIAILSIKGPMLHKQGFRMREHSGDVDLFAEPARVEDLADLLTEWGWDLWPDVWRGTTVNHSVTLQPTSWGCEVDIHRRMPGCAIDDETSFRILTEVVEMTRFAGVSVPTPTLGAHAVIHSLHQVRPSWGTLPSNHVLDECKEELVRDGQEALGIAMSLRATEALREPLQRAFPGVSLPEDQLPSNWRWRQHSNRVRGYLAALRLAPLRKRPLVLLRLLWPKQSEVTATNRRAGQDVEGALRARWVRMRRALFG